MTVTVEVALPEAALGERIRGTLRKLDDGGYELAAPVDSQRAGGA